MAPAALVNHGEKLEVNLIEPVREVDDEGRSVRPGYHPVHESFGQPPFEQVRRSRIQPVLGQPEVRRDSRPGDQEDLRKRFSEAQFAVLGDCKEIYVSGRAPDQAEGTERGTAYDHDLNLTAEYLQLIGQRGKERVDRLVGDLIFRSVAVEMLKVFIQGIQYLVPRC